MSATIAPKFDECKLAVQASAHSAHLPKIGILSHYMKRKSDHSHIGTLYDVGPNFLVMELVEGESSQNISSRRSTTVS